MSNSKLLAFVITLAIFIPLIAVPEIEENPFSYPQEYEEFSTPIKDYDIVSELKDLEKEGVATAVFQPEMEGMESVDENKDDGSGQQDEIRNLAGLLEIKPQLSDPELKDFLQNKLVKFDEADLHPSYFIIPDMKYRNRVSSILDDIASELELPRVQLMVKDDETEISTDLLVYLDREAAFSTLIPLDTLEGENARNARFEVLVMDYFEHHATGSNILAIDSQDWSPNVAKVLNSFVDVININDIDIIIRIENISKETSTAAFSEIISFCQSSAAVDELPLDDGAPGTRGGSEARDVKASSGGHVQEIILGAMSETSDMKTVSEGRFAIIMEVINGFYYIILLTCVLPNLYFVAWAGFIRNKKARAKKSGLKEKVDPKENGFNKRLQYLEKQLGRAILFNSEVSGRGQERRFISTEPTGKPMRAQNDKKWPDVTIIVPCFNEQKGIAMAVERCFNQTYKGRIEVLIVDDGSRDYTLRIAKIFEAPFPNRTVRAFHKENGGKADALNFGIERATGQIILTTDGDSHMDPDCVEAVVRGYRANPHAGVVGGFVVIRNEKDSTLVKMQQIEYIFTQDVFRLPQSESASVLIIPGPVFSMGGRVAKTHTASTRTCVEDADLTDTILSDNWGTVAVTDATAHTQAPVTWKAWYKQRKRWVYGQFQVWRENKSFLKKNFWGVYSYFTWMSALFITAMLAASMVALAFIGEWNFFSLLITAQTTVIYVMYFVTRGISLARYKYGRHLIWYLPLQSVYDLVNGVLCATLFLRYLLGKGVQIKFGPELVRIY